MKEVQLNPETEKILNEEVRGTVKKPIKDQDPRDIIGRCLTLENLRTIPIPLIEKLSPKFDHMLLTKTSSTLDANGNPVTKGSLNWEYLLFDAPQKEILDLFNNFVKVKKKDDQQGE